MDEKCLLLGEFAIIKAASEVYFMFHRRNVIYRRKRERESRLGEWCWYNACEKEGWVIGVRWEREGVGNRTGKAQKKHLGIFWSSEDKLLTFVRIFQPSKLEQAKLRLPQKVTTHVTLYNLFIQARKEKIITIKVCLILANVSAQFHLQVAADQDRSICVAMSVRT